MVQNEHPESPILCRTSKRNHRKEKRENKQIVAPQHRTAQPIRAQTLIRFRYVVFY